MINAMKDSKMKILLVSDSSDLSLIYATKFGSYGLSTVRQLTFLYLNSFKNKGKLIIPGFVTLKLLTES